MKRKLKIYQGFTLIELLVVISIIGVLATLILANFNSARQRARDAQRKSDLREIKAALMMYHNDFGQFPATGTGNKIAGCGDGTADCEWGSSWQITETEMIYIKYLPEDPLSPSRTYQYQQKDSGKDFCLWASLENKGDAEISKSQDRCSGCTVGDTTTDYVVCAD